MTVDVVWLDALRAACDPVFAAADAGFEWNEHVHFDADRPTLLWEADPARFAARYPDSRIERSYGDQWPPPCIDYWLHVDPVRMTARLSVEGWDLSDTTLDIAGDGSMDGQAVAAAFAAVLRVST
jgi:hypothetical protein